MAPGAPAGVEEAPQVELTVRGGGWVLTARMPGRAPVLGVSVAELAAHLGDGGGDRLQMALASEGVERVGDWLPRAAVMEALVLAGGREAARAAREVEGAFVAAESALGAWLRRFGEGAALAVVGEGEGDLAERARIMAALRESGGSKLAAAKALGIPRRTFYRRLAAFGL